MKISIAELFLDEENPRFHIDLESITEDSIFSYMLEYEDLKGLVDSIKKIGFKQIGERMIVIKEESKYIVVEGNRRLCALKAICNLLGDGQFTSDNQKLLSELNELDVDVAESRDSIQEYLAAKHIDGIQEWKAEAKRKFYAKQYMSGKSIEQVLAMTPEKRGAVVKYIKEYLFLQDFKNKSGLEIIDKPSIIYERIYSRFIDLRLLEPITVEEEYIDTSITYNYQYLNDEEILTFIKGFGKAIVVNKDVNSRHINKIQDFKELMNKEQFQNKYTDLTNLYKKISKKMEQENYSARQLVKEKFVDISLPLERIFDCSGYEHEPQIVIQNSNGEIVTEISNAPTDTYHITINEKSYYFNINDVLEPEIRIRSNQLEDVIIGNSFNLDSVITIFDIHGKTLRELNTNSVILSIEPSEKVVISNSSVTINEAGQYCLIVTYKCKYRGNEKYQKHTRKFFNVSPITMPSNDTQEIKYFDFKVIRQNYLSENATVSDHLIDELESAYQEGHFYIFASALRSVMESISFELTETAKSENINSMFSSNNLRSFEERSNIIKQLLSDTNSMNILLSSFANSNNLSFKDLKNYFQVHLPNAEIDVVISTLHLGAHKSMTLIDESNLEDIKRKVVAWIELIYILKATNYCV